MDHSTLNADTLAFNGDTLTLHQSALTLHSTDVDARTLAVGGPDCALTVDKLDVRATAVAVARAKVHAQVVRLQSKTPDSQLSLFLSTHADVRVAANLTLPGQRNVSAWAAVALTDGARLRVADGGTAELDVSAVAIDSASTFVAKDSKVRWGGGARQPPTTADGWSRRGL